MLIRRHHEVPVPVVRVPDDPELARITAADLPSEQPSGSRAALRLLRIGFALLALIAGADKFAGLLTDWEQYLSPALVGRLPVDPHTFLLGVGAIEIAAGVLVLVLPRLGGALLALWLWAIVANLLSIPDFFDIALRDAALALGALALSLLASERHQLGKRQRDGIWRPGTLLASRAAARPAA